MSSCNERSTRPVWWLLAIVYVLLVHCLAANITFSSVFHLSFCFCLNSNAAPPASLTRTRTHAHTHAHIHCRFVVLGLITNILPDAWMSLLVVWCILALPILERRHRLRSKIHLVLAIAGKLLKKFEQPATAPGLLAFEEDIGSPVGYVFFFWFCFWFWGFFWLLINGKLSA